MSLAVLGTVYPVIFISELPDKTMFAALVLATRGRGLAVWIGAATAFAVHVCIAVTIGAALFTWLPQRVVQALVAAMFLGGAAWLLLRSSAEPGAAGPSLAESTDAKSAATEPTAAVMNIGGAGGSEMTGAEQTGAARSTPNSTAGVAAPDSSRRVFVTTFVVVFLAEWGDLTQILTASLAARFHAPIAVGVSAGLALWSVTALAVVASRPLRRLPAALVRRLTGIVLLVLAGFATVAAVTAP